MEKTTKQAAFTNNSLDRYTVLILIRCGWDKPVVNDNSVNYFLWKTLLIKLAFIGVFQDYPNIDPDPHPSKEHLWHSILVLHELLQVRSAK